MSHGPTGRGEFRSRRSFREAQGTRSAAEGANVGSPFLWILSFGEAKESSSAAGRTPAEKQLRVSATRPFVADQEAKDLCADARLISVPGVPGRHVTFLVSLRKVTQRRRPGIRALRCATGSLCFSAEAAAAELAPALRSGTQTVLADTPASACDARRSSREPVRGGANGSGLRFVVFSLGCTLLWYWPAGKATRQYQSGLQGRGRA